MRTKYDTYNGWSSLFIVTCETLITGALFYVLFLATENTPWHQILKAPHLQVILTVMLCYFVSAMQIGVVLYRRKVYSYQILGRVLRSTVFFGILSGVILRLGDFMDSFSYFYLTFLILLFLCLAIFRITMRWGLKKYRSRGGNIRYVVLVGSSENNRELYHELASQSWAGYRVNGYFDFQPNPEFPQECPYLGQPQEVEEYLEKNGNTHYLFCCLPSKEHVIIRSLINYCENHLVHFYSVPNIYNYLHNRVYFNMLGNVPFLSLRPDPLSKTGNKILKRTFDIVFSLLFLCTFFPIILVIVTIVTKITMPGPVFFKQKRNGLNDKEFYCYKFRSMKVNAQADTLQATKDDPRKTRWGNIMRKTNIDELPQFINVLLGDMSIVGPRPHMLKHTEEYSKLINKYMVRHL